MEHKIPPPILFALTGVVMALLTRVGPVAGLPPGLRLALGGAAGTAGLLTLMLGARTFFRAGTTIDPVHIDRASSLVTTGVYRYTRNPMYVGFTLMLLGWACYLAVPWALLGPVFFLLFITRWQIRPEERIMLARFGLPYEAYMGRVPRWV